MVDVSFKRHFTEIFRIMFAQANIKFYSICIICSGPQNILKFYCFLSHLYRYPYLVIHLIIIYDLLFSDVSTILLLLLFLKAQSDFWSQDMVSVVPLTFGQADLRIQPLMGNSAEGGGSPSLWQPPCVHTFSDYNQVHGTEEGPNCSRVPVLSSALLFIQGLQVIRSTSHVCTGSFALPTGQPSDHYYPDCTGKGIRQEFLRVPSNCTRAGFESDSGLQVVFLTHRVSLIS